MSELTPYQAEQARSEREHHKPTAGAMIGHITSNLVIHAFKIEQARLFAKGVYSSFLQDQGKSWLKQELAFIDQLNQALLAEDDLIPTTSSAFQEFSMLTEDAANKYHNSDDQLFDLIKDFDTQLLFIKKAIALAEQEQHYGQILVLEKLYAWIKEQIALGQHFLNHEITSGLYQED
ncbi:DNA-binding protein [Lactobacillus corticis]|uniref:DNA-binding ferritin-like protein n=1 Tax=Lactobacillus corticis TaxID=2201249 RepID=A0A916QFQ9_9LACO|nr:DNA-binding protein [Lactobacillus corticis]GFZ26456.1 DNA-binding ferritin-like protein [Lactobacillus corticis]